MINDCVDGETCDGMDVQFGGDMLAVGNDRVLGYTQHIRYLFVTQTTDYLNQHVPFPSGKFLRLVFQQRGLWPFRVSNLKPQRSEYIIFNRTMVRKIMLRVP